MRRGRILIFLVLIVVIGLALLYFAYTQLGGVSPQPTQPALTKVFFAAQNIPPGTKITREMIDTFSIPPENVADVMFTETEVDALVGQTARYPIDQGVIITAPMVGSGPVATSGPAEAAQIPTGMVAEAIPTNRLSLVGYGVKDGAHVNLNACMLFVDIDPAFQTELPNFTAVLTGTGFGQEGAAPVLSVSIGGGGEGSRQGRFDLDPSLGAQAPLYVVPSEAQRPRLVCQMILQDVVVLKVGNFASQPAPAAQPNATPAPQAQPEANPDIVTLMVNPQDSISLNYFIYSGAVLSMSLRNPNDTSRFAAESATLTSLLTQYNISLPSKLPYALQPRLDVLAPPSQAITVQPQQ
ncbi:MAG TPA: SAF domain-containing protein [Anaerolineales bacterium]|nr:SAF domain-containing protein [Anaerolineales bacterium]HLO29496.1 SAF domain-containing protein [Anaerolineales bacterium]